MKTQEIIYITVKVFYKPHLLIRISIKIIEYLQYTSFLYPVSLF